jgi:hypothetical protein
MNIADLLKDDEEQEQEDKKPAPRFPWPYALATEPQLLEGRTRKCAFWISPMVRAGMRYIFDSSQLVQGASWTHNPAQDSVPEDALLVVVSPRDADQIRKAMATFSMVPHPSFVAARIIDDECSRDPTLPGRMRWKVVEEKA